MKPIILSNLKSGYTSILIFLFTFLICDPGYLVSQVSYGSTTAFGLRKTVPAYNGNAILVRRTCDNATSDIGFTSCGNLDTVALNKFVLASNPISAINLAATAAYSLRKLRCVYAGNAINVRRACDDATKDIGFTANGDLDTTALKSFVLSATPLSALSVSAGAAFSLRKLRCAYAGSAIRVRSSAAGSPTVDVGFTANGDLDTASMKTFVGANNAFVTIWYDQSGNGNHAVQATTGNQPQIMTAGKVNRQGGSTGRPAIIFSAALTSFLQIPYSAGSLNFGSASTTNAVFARTGVPTGDAAIFDQIYTPNNISVALSWNDGTGASTPLSIGHFPSSAWSFVALPTDVTLNTNNIITGTMLSGAANTTTMNLYQNGTVAASATNKLTIGTSAAQPFNIGKRWDLADYAPANMQELIVFASVLSATDRQYLEWGQSQYYSISGPALTTVPVGAPSAYVTKWYDQSGNARDVMQSVLANQPQIMSAGKVLRQNSIPAIAFNSASAQTFTLNSLMMTDKISVSIVAKVNSVSARNCLFDLGAIPGSYPDFCIEANTYSTAGNRWGIYANNNSLDAATATSTNLTTLSLIANNTYTASANVIANTTFYKNGTAATLSCNSCVTSVYRSSWPNGMCIGNFNGAYAAYTDGFIPEFIIFPSALSNVNRQYLEWSQAQYYSITGPTLAGLPSAAPSGFVTTWYDQSGNGNNITQATTTRQPTIVNAGSIVKLGTRPAILGTTASQTNLTLTLSTSYTGTQLTTNSVLQSDVGSTANLRIVSVGNTALTSADYNNGNYFNINQRNTNQFVIERNSIISPNTVFTVGSPMILSGRFSGANRQLFNNGTGSGTQADATAFNFNSLRILQSINPAFEAGESLTGKMSEFGLYYSSLSSTRRTLLETNQAVYHNIAISNSKYTPPTTTSYNLFVNGIGREAANDSVYGTRSTTGMGTSVTSGAGDFLKDDGDYLTYGMNCFATPYTSTSNLPATVTQRWENDWYVNKTDVSSNNGTLNIFFDFSDYGVAMTPGVAANYVLLNRNSSSGTFAIVAGTTVSVVGDRVVFAVDASNITTNFYYTIGTKNVTTSPLPIELVSFNCNMTDSKTVELKWVTASESNSSYFSVERSADGINFESIGKVNGAGNSVTTLNYSLTDNSALKEISYYRLKSVDLDGSYKYSALCSVDNANTDNDRDLNIYPNPTNGSITVDFNHSAYSQPDTYSIMDITGKKIEVVVIRNTNSITLDMSSLEPGIYMLEVLKGNKKTIKKITLQK